MDDDGLGRQPRRERVHVEHVLLVEGEAAELAHLARGCRSFMARG